jgi:hypothetical protein
MHKYYFIPRVVFQDIDHGNTKDAKKKVTGYLENACRAAGFSVVAGRTRLTHKGAIRKHDFHCKSVVPESKRQR